MNLLECWQDSPSYSSHSILRIQEDSCGHDTWPHFCMGSKGVLAGQAAVRNRHEVFSLHCGNSEQPVAAQLTGVSICSHIWEFWGNPNMENPDRTLSPLSFTMADTKLPIVSWRRGCPGHSEMHQQGGLLFSKLLSVWPEYFYSFILFFFPPKKKKKCCLFKAVIFTAIEFLQQ